MAELPYYDKSLKVSESCYHNTYLINKGFMVCQWSYGTGIGFKRLSPSRQQIWYKLIVSVNKSVNKKIDSLQLDYNYHIGYFL